MFSRRRAGSCSAEPSTTTEGAHHDQADRRHVDVPRRQDRRPGRRHHAARPTWFFDGDTEVGPFRVSEGSAKLLRDAFESIGALIGGRRYFDLADGWGGHHPMGVPVYILTHEPPADWPSDSTIHFVTDGLESAVAQAREAAGGKDIGVATPSLVRQCLDAGLLDELQINVVPSCSATAGRSSTASSATSSSRAPR